MVDSSHAELPKSQQAKRPVPAAVPPLWRGWLALWGPFPLLNWLGMLGALRFRLLPLELRWLLGAALGLHLLSSLFTPHPQAALILGSLRSLFIAGLVVTGWRLGRARQLLNLLPGLVAVLITALIYTAMQTGPGAGLPGRLLHPSYQYVSLGLAAALTLWLAVWWPGGRSSGPGWQTSGWQTLRWASGLLAALVLLLGGSRAPLAAALIGLALGGWCSGSVKDWGSVAAGVRRRWLLVALILGGGVTVLALGVGRSAAPLTSGLLNGAATHLTQLGLNGRDTYWEEAAGVFRALPLGGSGVGQLGNLVRSNQENCFQGWPTQGVGCPGWMLSLAARPWFAPARKLSWLAHNAALHSLAETGLIGTTALFLLLGLMVAAALASRSALLISVITGYSVVSLFDNAATLPSLAVSEVFWLAGGVALREAYQVTGGAFRFFCLRRAAAWGAGLLLLTLVPVLLPELLPASGPPPRLLALNVGTEAASAGSSTLFLGLGRLPVAGGGPLRLRLELCTPICGVERVQDLTPDAGGEWWGAVGLPRLAATTTVRLQILPPQGGLLGGRPLGEVVWRQP